MYRNNRGFTLIEIIAVLVLMSIIAAGVLVRGMNTDQIDLIAQTAKIRNQIRYAQAPAMKRSEVWGIKCFANQYWLFEGNNANSKPLPGEKIDIISLTDLGVGMNAFTVYFDELGVPWKFYDFVKVTTGNPLNITISGASDSVTLSITPETGLIQ
jgi:prepilin-type N-terminal cleavage/methylation domain-containing protein